jgi:hypothetical protein
LTSTIFSPQRQLKFPIFTTDVDTTAGRETEWSVAQRSFPACGQHFS